MRLSNIIPLIALGFLTAFSAAAQRREMPVIDGHGTGAIVPTPAELAQLPQANWDTLRKYAPVNARLHSLMKGTGLVSLPAPPIMDQGSQGSCVGFGYACLMSTMLMEAQPSGTSYSNSITRSPSFIYNQIHVAGCGDGSNPSDAVNLLKTKGDCSWNDMGYNQSNCTTQPTQAQLNAAALCKGAQGSAWLTSNSLSAIKGALDLGYPIGACFNASAFSLSNGVVTGYSNSGANHCVCIIGYDDNTQRVKVQNSWGTWWGASGYFYVPYAAVSNNFFCGGLGVIYGIITNTPTTAKAVIYSDCSYGGAVANLNVGSYNYSDLISLGIGNDQLSSLKVTSGYKVTLYADGNFSGATKTYTSDMPCLISDNFNDVTSSLKVEANTQPACANAYEPNESYAAAATVAFGSSIQAAIPTATDVDYFKVVMPASGQTTFKLVVPAGVDLELAVYGPNNNLLAQSTNPAGTNELVYINAGGQYCVAKVWGYNGAASSSCYTFLTSAGQISAPAGAAAQEMDLVLSPNPATDKFRLHLTNAKGGEAAIRVMNLQGQIVMSRTATLGAGENDLTLTRDALPAGTYLVQVAHNGGQIVRRIVLQ